MERTATRSESLLRPREIQVRIRAGQTPETVAAAAQTSVDRVMVFATPVLAERAFVAQQAARASVRRRVGDGPVGLLGDAVTRRLESAGIEPDATAWDAWRREDGRWTVVATWSEGGAERQAAFTYDAMGRYVVAEDDPARWLVGERRAPEPARTAGPPDRTDETRDQSRDDLRDPREDAAGQLALGDDALEVVTGRPLSAVRTPVRTPAPIPAPAAGPAPEAVRADSEPTEDLTETVRAVRAVGAPRPSSPARQPVPVPAPSLVPPSSAADSPGPGDGEEDLTPVTRGDGDGLFADTDLRADAGAPARRPARGANASRSRRSMPSWDDIVLGSAPRGD